MGVRPPRCAQASASFSNTELYIVCWHRLEGRDKGPHITDHLLIAVDPFFAKAEINELGELIDRLAFELLSSDGEANFICCLRALQSIVVPGR